MFELKNCLRLKYDNRKGKNCRNGVQNNNQILDEY